MFCLSSSGVSSGCCERMHRAEIKRHAGERAGAQVFSGFQDPGPWAEGHVLMLDFTDYFSALRTDCEDRPTKGQQGVLLSFLLEQPPQILFCFGQCLRCCSLKTLFYTIYCSCQMPIFTQSMFCVMLVLTGEKERKHFQMDTMCY